MIKEHKELLLKDLSARLPYGVKFSIEIYDERHKYKKSIGKLFQLNCNCFWVYEDDFERYIYSEENKPYLFPISSMTKELKNFIRWKLTTPKYDSFDEESLEDLFNNNIQVVNFCYEHHLDINGLIEKGLALDATNLNIY